MPASEEIQRRIGYENRGIPCTRWSRFAGLHCAHPEVTGPTCRKQIANSQRAETIDCWKICPKPARASTTKTAWPVEKCQSLEFGARSDANRYALLLIAPWAERQAEGKQP